jgi:hypothetical protein
MKYAVLVCLFLLAGIYSNNMQVDRLAKDFVTEQLSKHKVKGWSSMSTAVPVFAIFLSSYDVMVEVRRNGAVEFVPTKIKGTCLQSCVIELDTFDFLQLI